MLILHMLSVILIFFYNVYLNNIQNNKYTFYKLKIIFIYILQSLHHNKTFPIQVILKIVLFQYVPFET